MATTKRNSTGEKPGAQAQTGAAERSPLTAEEKYKRIAHAAYLRAAARNFQSGDRLRDWLDAEIEVNEAIERELEQSGNDVIAGQTRR